jgi:WD40 repeat protein
LGEPRELTAGLSDGLRGLSRDGRFLAYASGLSNPVLYLKDLTTGRQRALSPKAVAIGPTRFNAAGTQVFFDVCTSADVARLGWKAAPCRVYEAPTSGGVPEVMHLPVDNGLLLSDLLGHDKILYGTYQPDRRAHFEIVDVGGARRIRFLDDPARDLWQGTVSKDGQWVTFNATTASNSQIYIVPYREALVPVAEWIPVTDGSAWDDKPRFSPDGRMLFFISHRDGFFCIWAQRLGKDMRPAGKMFTVYHSHQARRSIENFPFASLDLEVGPGTIVFSQTALTGNIWMLDPAGQDNWNQPSRGNPR